jgi:hypothetical protein
VNVTWYTIDGVYFEGTGFTFDGYDDGAFEFSYGARDNVGNNKTELTITIYLDSHPPTTDLDIGGRQYRSSENDSWNLTKASLFELSATDEYAGVNITWYTINGTYFEGIEFDLTEFSDGPHTVTWGSIDYLEQNETGHSITVNLDSHAPTTEMVIGEPKYREKSSDFWNITSATLFTLFPSDPYSGLNLTWYTIDGYYYEGTTFNLTGYSDDYHTLTWGSRDNLGNIETDNITTVYVNTIFPSTILAIEGPQYRKTIEDHWNVTDETLFRLSPASTHPGINFTWYAIDGQYFEYDGTPFTLSGYNDGPHYITWGSTNNLDQNETAQSITVNLDTASPETSIHISSPKYRDDTEDEWAVIVSTIFTLTPYDNRSGVAFTWYEIDGVYFAGTSFTLSGYNDGQYTIVWGSEDNLGHNETESSLVIDLDSTPPFITIDIGEPTRSLGDVRYINSSTPITLILVDSGVNQSIVYYSLDGGARYLVYNSPFTVPSSMTTTIMYSGEDILGNRADESIFNVTVDNRDTDRDGIDDLSDEDDDNDGLLDTEEDKNKNGIVDKGETDFKNPDTDGDGHSDKADAYPLDKDRWEKEGNITGILLLVCVVVVIALVIFFLLIRKHGEAEVEWMDTEEPSECDVKWTSGEEPTFEPEEEQVEWASEEEVEFEPGEE